MNPIASHLPVKLIHGNTEAGYWRTSFGMYLLKDEHDDLFIVHGEDADEDDDREYFQRIKIKDDDIRLQFGRNVFTIRDIISMVGAF